MRRPRIAVLAAAVMTACVLAVAAVPAAAGAEAGPRQALVRVAHFSPDASYVDVYMVSLNRRQLFPNVFYKSVSAYWAVAAGPFTYEVRAAGASPESPPVIQVKGNLAAGRAYTVAAVGRRDRLQGVLLRDDMAPSAPGKAKVRFLDAAYDLPSVDIAVAGGGPLLGSGVAFPEPTGYRQLASGRYRVEVRRSGAGAVLVEGTVAVRPGTVTSVALVGGAGEPREQVAAPGPGSVPVRLVIPAIGVATPLVRLGLEPDGAMQVPGDFATAGWFAGGPAPGQLGPAVIAGHVDSRTGPAVFYRLRDLRPGDRIGVVQADGTRLGFVVEQARSYPKAAFPTGAVFGPVPSAALRLITCTGDFDRARGSYRDNLVVFARLAG